MRGFVLPLFSIGRMNHAARVTFNPRWRIDSTRTAALRLCPALFFSIGRETRRFLDVKWEGSSCLSYLCSAKKVLWRPVSHMEDSVE